MRIRLNFKLLLGTVAGLALAGTGIHFLHAYQVSRNAGLLLRQADLSVEQGKPEQAATLLAWYLSYQPTDTEALARYGLLLEKQARSPATRFQAMLVLEEALRRDPQRTDVRFRLIHCLILLGKDRFPSAIKHLEVLAPAWPVAGEIEHWLGWCYEAMGDFPHAVEWFSKAVAKTSSRLASYVLQAEVLQFRLDQPDEALQVMDQMVAANANWHQAYLERARFRQKLGQNQEADRDIARALALAPTDLGALLAAAESAQAAGDFKKAHALIERGLSQHPAESVLYKVLAGLEFRAGDHGKAIASLQRGIRKATETGDLRALLADLYIEQGKLAEAKQILTELQAENALLAVTDYVRARLLMVERKWGAAVDVLERCRSELPSGSDWRAAVDFSVGTCYGRLGDADHQLAAYERAVARNSTWTAARMGLGAALLAAGRVDEALLQFRAVETSPAPPTELWLLLARTLIIRTQRLPAAQRDWSAIDGVLLKIAQLRKGSVDVSLLRADMLVAQGKASDASTLLAQASEADANEPKLWCVRAELAARQGRPDEARQLLDLGQRRLGDKLDFRLTRLRLCLQQGGPVVKQTLAGLGQKTATLPAENRVLLNRALAEAWARLGELEASRILWQELAKQLPHDLQCRFALFELALKKNRLRDARELWSEIQRLDGANGLLALYGKAALIVAQGGKGEDGTLAQAKKILAELSRKQENWAKLPLLEARLADLEHDPNRAVEHSLRAFELGERPPGLGYRLASLLLGRRQYREAEQVIRRLEEDGPLDRKVSALGAEISLAQQDAPRALLLAKRAVPADSRDYRELQWLAWVLDMAGAAKDAETTLRRALDVARHNPDTWVALIHHLARTGQAAAADVVLNEARVKLHADRRDLAIARALEVLGRLDQAESLFVKCASDRPHDFIALEQAASFYRRQDRPDQAEAHLRRLLEPVCAAPGEVAVWARRHLAVLLAGRDTVKDRQQALELLEVNSQQVKNDASDARAQAFIRASSKEQVRTAIQVFERAPGPLSPVEQTWLIQLHEKAGDYDNARDWALNLLARDPDNPQYLARYVRILLHQGQVQEAQRILNRLERIEPNSSRMRELKDAVAKALTS